MRSQWEWLIGLPKGRLISNPVWALIPASIIDSIPSLFVTVNPSNKLLS